MGRASLRSEAGFTIVELLAAMTAGLVVLSALVTIMTVTLKSTTRTFTQLDATGRVRPVFQVMENELHSACFTGEETPVQVGSGPNALIFLSSTGNGPTPTQLWHEIVYNPGPANTLVDTTYQTSSSLVNGTLTWARGTRVSARTLLTNVAAATGTSVFQYFAYQQAPTTDAAGNPYMILPDGMAPIPGTSTTVYNPLAPGAALSAAQAASAAEVLITLVVGPGGHANENTNLANTGVTVTDAVGFRLTPAANHVGNGATFAPCQ
jgi:Tfp pilus assembly protein PilW